jgi:iron complex outermembrane receptor protein
MDPADQNSATMTFAAAVQADPTIATTFNSTNATYGAPGITVLVPGTVVAAPGAITNSLSEIDNRGYAGYTQGTFDITDALSLTVGARLTSERKRVLVEIYAVDGGFVGARVRRPGELDFGFERSTRSTDISPMVNLAYQVNDDAMVYTTYSKGFKSGGFNGRANDPVLTNKIDDETLTTYEAGFKSQLFDNKMRLNGAGYWSIYKDIQLTIPRGINNAASIQVVNVGKAEIKGAELELLAQILPSLELSTSLGIINSHYTTFDDPGNAFATGRRLPATPAYTGNIGLGYTLPPTPIGDLRTFFQWSYRGKSGTDVVDSRELRKDKNGELSGSITLALPDGKTEISLFGKNLLDREYFVNGVNLSDSLGIAYKFYNEPRQYGIELRRRF